MAAEGELSTFFPVPPPFFRSFTQANRDRLKEFVEISSGSESGANDTFITQQLSDLLPEVRLLIPPVPPSDGIHKSFNAELGGPQPTLQDMGAEQLVPTTQFPSHSSHSSPASKEPPETDPTHWTQQRAHHLKKLTQSIMLNFLELLGLLSVHPDHATDKIADLEVLFLNAHNLINEYRPHQARDELIRSMRKRVDGLQAEIDGVTSMKGKLEGLLAELRGAGEEVARAGSEENNDIDGFVNGGNQRVTRERKRRRDAEIWRALNVELPT